MNRKIIRKITFQLHRWLGLVAGILLCIAGLTGSILVFEQKIDNFLLGHQMGHVMGDRIGDDTWLGFTFKLHYQLLAGETGTIIMGIVALVTLTLSITGIVLWPGWRKLISGFKIKWEGHIKRVNFDIHKVAGIVTAIFLAFIGFTGFCWNFYAQAEPAIYAATFTPKPPDPVSQPIPSKQPLSLTELLQRADTAVPNAPNTWLFLPTKPADPLWLAKKQPEETSKWGNTQIYLDQFSGKVLQIQDGLNPTRAEVVLNSFSPLHYGTFGGLPTRILYIFVGLAPLISFITGFVMWWYRQKIKRVGV